jgi:hypothetical protein
MATCKECIHYKPCSAKPLTPKWCGTDNGVCDIENLCPYFESQSDYDRLKNDYKDLKIEWCNLVLDNLVDAIKLKELYIEDIPEDTINELKRLFQEQKENV